jgi:hypothetical protein
MWCPELTAHSPNHPNGARGYGLASDPSIVEEAKQRALEEAAAGPFPENATRRVREMFEGNGASDAERRIEAQQKRLEAERDRLVEQNRRHADNRLLQKRRRERREREEREHQRRERPTRRPPPDTSRGGAARA